MDIFPEELWDSCRLSSMRSDTILVYLALRACKKHDQNPTTDFLIQKLGLSRITVTRSVGELKKKGWISDAYTICPEQFLSSKASYQSSKLSKEDARRQMIEKARLNIIDSTNHAISSEVTGGVRSRRKGHNVTDLVLAFEQAYTAKYEETPAPATVKTRSQLSRLVRWCGGDKEKVRDMLVWAVDNWEHVSRQMKLGGTPTIAFVSTGTVWQRIRDIKTERGVLQSQSNRYRKTDSPTEGYGDL
jgi:hypothetical protein